jgi:hypothetical protein
VHERSRLRIDETLGEAIALHGEVDAWRSGWDAVDAVGGHLTHLDLLAAVLRGLVDEIARRTAAIDLASGTGAVYEECRRSDLRLLHARRLWRWYADKLDQRAGAPDDLVVRTLLAADEVVWSCWKTAFTGLGKTVPPAPIPYLAAQYSATATPRTDPPPELRPGLDDLLRRHLEELPVATIGLPPICCRRPWWIVLGAHEAGHHVQFESAGLERLAQEQVWAAAYAVVDDTSLAEEWLPWCRELFADAFSVLLVGPAAIWAAAELETRTPAGLRKSPSSGYPPPLVRLAVLRAVAEQAGLPVPVQALADLADPVTKDDERLRKLLAAADRVATVLLGLEWDSGRALRSLGGGTALAYAPGGSVARWRAELLGADEPIPLGTLDAARFCVAGGVDAWERFGGQAGLTERLSRRMRTILPQCAEPGVRAAGVARDADIATRRIVADLYAADAGRLG